MKFEISDDLVPDYLRDEFIAATKRLIEDGAAFLRKEDCWQRRPEDYQRHLETIRKTGKYEATFQYKGGRILERWLRDWLDLEVHCNVGIAEYGSFRFSLSDYYNENKLLIQHRLPEQLVRDNRRWITGGYADDRQSAQQAYAYCLEQYRLLMAEIKKVDSQHGDLGKQPSRSTARNVVRAKRTSERNTAAAGKGTAAHRAKPKV